MCLIKLISKHHKNALYNHNNIVSNYCSETRLCEPMLSSNLKTYLLFYNYNNSNKIFGEKVRWELHKDAVCCF